MHQVLPSIQLAVLGLRLETSRQRQLNQSVMNSSGLARRCVQYPVCHAILSRQLAGVRGTTLIINLPGSPKSMRETLEVIPGYPVLCRSIGGPDTHARTRWKCMSTPCEGND